MKALYIFLIFVGITTNLFGTLNEQGERTTNSTISLELGGGTVLGVSYNYFLNKNLELELGLGPLSLTSGFKYHFYINDNFTTYMSINASYYSDIFCDDGSFSIFSSLIGLRYETDFGLTTYLGIGVAFAPSHIHKVTECDDDWLGNDKKIEAAFRPYGGLKIGYAF